jgi:RNA polymerase sigma-70 factor (ECF subfamily)
MEPDAFARLVRTHQARLFGLVLMMVRDRAGAEEVTQDAFLRAYTHIRQYDASRPFYPWLAAIAVRLAQNWLVHRGRTLRHERPAPDDTREPSAPAPALVELMATERRQRLWDAVASLPSGERTAVFLYYRDDLPLSDIAQAVGVTTGTIKTLLFRARRHLRERLGAEALFEQDTPA